MCKHKRELIGIAFVVQEHWTRSGDTHQHLETAHHLRICTRCKIVEYRTAHNWKPLDMEMATKLKESGVTTTDAVSLVICTIASGKLIQEWPPSCDISKDRRGRLHREDGPAMCWLGHIERYYWHGIEIPSHWIMKPERITRNEFMREENAERRRILYEILGRDAVLRILNAKLIDEDPSGYPKLYEAFDPKVGVFKMVQVRDPSTGQIYSHFVDNQYTKARQAVAGMFGMTEDGYHPIVET